MLTMLLQGDHSHLEAFITHFKEQPFVTIVDEKKVGTGAMELKFTTNLLKPSLVHVANVEMVTLDEQVISIELLHPIETKINEHTRQISGMSYDIFASPDVKSRDIK